MFEEDRDYLADDPIPFIVVDRPPRVGDLVRVPSFEGILRGGLSTGRVMVKSADQTTAVNVDELIVLEPGPKVGDPATYATLAALPPLSAVVSDAGLVAQKYEDGWHCSSATGTVLSDGAVENWPATVIYIGHQS